MVSGSLFSRRMQKIATTPATRAVHVGVSECTVLEPVGAMVVVQVLLPCKRSKRRRHCTVTWERPPVWAAPRARQKPPHPDVAEGLEQDSTERQRSAPPQWLSGSARVSQDVNPLGAHVIQSSKISQGSSAGDRESRSYSSVESHHLDQDCLGFLLISGKMPNQFHAARGVEGRQAIPLQ